MPKTSVIDPSGAPRDVDDSELAAALQRGWRLPTPEEPQRLSSEAASEENYGGFRGGVESTFAGLGRGLTLGGSDLALKWAGGKGAAEDLIGLQRENRGLSIGSEILGNVAPFLATGGTAGALAKTPAGLLSGVGKAIAEEGGASLGGRALAATAGAAAEGGIQSGATYISQSALEDKPLSAEGFVGAVGHGALWAAPIGGALTLGEAGLIRARKLFPKAQVSAVAAQGIKREATAALVDAATDGEQMAQTARKQLDLVDAKTGMADLTEQQTRRAFGAADPGSIGDQVAGGVEKAQLQEALSRYEASKANLDDWIRSEADPDLEAALLGVAPPEVGQPGGRIEKIARGSEPTAAPNQDLLDALDMRARQLDSTAVGKKKVPEALVEGVKETVPAVADAPDATRAGKRPAGLLADAKAQIDSSKPREIRTENQYRKIKDDFRSRLTEDEIKKSLRYSTEDYNDVNRHLRNGSEINPESAKIIPALDAILDKSTAPESIITHRSAHFDAGTPNYNLQPGDTFTDPGFMSTAWRSKNIERFGNVHFVITSPKGTKIAPIPSRAVEGELLLPRGTKLNITKREELPDGRVRLSATVDGGQGTAQGFKSPPRPAEVPEGFSITGKDSAGRDLFDEDPAVVAGIPDMADVAEGAARQVAYVVRPSELLSAGAKVNKASKPANGAIEAHIFEDGSYVVDSGMEKLTAAAESGDQPVLVRFSPKVGKVKKDVEPLVLVNPDPVESMMLKSETKPLVKGGQERTYITIERKLSDGEVVPVGTAEFIHRGDKLYPESANVDPAWQRKGIGTRMYQEAERITGKKVVPSENQTEAGKAFSEKFRKGRPSDSLTGLLRGTKEQLDAGVSLKAISDSSDLRKAYVTGKELDAGRPLSSNTKIPSYADLIGEDRGITQTVDSRMISDRGWYEPPGQGRDVVKADKARKAIAEGQRDPIRLGVTEDGKIVVNDGRNRLAAAVESGRPIKVTWEAAVGIGPDDVLKGGVRPAQDLGAKILEFGEPQVTKALGKRPGGGTDIGPDIARAARIITEHESSLAQLADVLGPAAPPTAVSRAQAFRQALAAQSKAYAGSAAKAAQGIDAKVAPAAAVGALPAPAVRTTFGGETVVDDQISKALQKETMRRPPAASDATVVDDQITKALRAHDMKTGRAAPAAPEAPAASGKYGVLSAVADVGTALEVLQAMGVHVPDISSIPVIGPVLSLYLKARAVLGILGRKGGSVGRSTESIIAAKSAGLRNRIVTATGGALEVAARGARRAAEVPKAPLAILGMSLFPGGESSKSKDPRVLYEARMDDLARAQQPGAVAQAIADRVQTSDPDLQDAITAQVERGIQFIASKAPKQAVLPGMLPGDGTWRPSKSSLTVWSRYIHAVNDPASVLEDLARGHLSIEGAEVLRTVYPKLFAEAQRALLEAAPKMQRTLPSSRRIAISIMYQVPVDPSMYPSHLQFLQAPAPGAQPAQPQAPQAGPAITGPLQIGAQTMTALDRRAGM